MKHIKQIRVKYWGSFENQPIQFEYRDYPVYEGIAYTKRSWWRPIILCRVLRIHEWDVFNCLQCNKNWP